MKMLADNKFMIEAGIPLPNHRDMSFYNGKPFHCACGQEHQFSDYMVANNFATTGLNAKMIVVCPGNSGFHTLIKTKYKFFFIFNGFVSLAGCQLD